MTREFWEKQVARATELAGLIDGAGELLRFYQHLLSAQAQIYQYCATQIPSLSGELERDLPQLHPALPSILSAVESAGPATLIEQARTLNNSTTEDVDRMLLTYWHEPTDTDFFAKAFLQPYGLFLTSSRSLLTNADAFGSERRCPFCGGKPQLSLLQNKETGAESGNRDLMCAKCLYVWPFRRAVCANCGEEQPAKLAYFQSPPSDHVRVEACDTCKHYLKGVDLTRLGKAQPLVDEVATAPLDLWATEHGYSKIELNLVGL
ncbi:MAG TPA: formate dehydrogenase accessory protein FdhE [Pyrinomonadaceae bacterium]